MTANFCMTESKNVTFYSLSSAMYHFTSSVGQAYKPPLLVSVLAQWRWASPSCHSVWQWFWGHHEGQSERDKGHFL